MLFSCALVNPNINLPRSDGAITVDPAHPPISKRPIPDDHFQRVDPDDQTTHVRMDIALDDGSPEIRNPPAASAPGNWKEKARVSRVAASRFDPR